MKLFKTSVIFYAILFISFSGYAQKQTYDIVSYTLPRGWQSKQVDGGVQLFITDRKTGGYAIAIVTKSMTSTGSADKDFTSQWKSLLVNTVNSITEPVKIEPAHDDGWEIHSGNGNYVDGNVKGLATLITATGYNQTVAAVLMTNTQQYQNDLLTFINSLELKKLSSNTTNNNTPTNNKVNNSSVVGLWVYYNTEISGYANGYAQLSGGYMRREYLFKADGTYTFRAKDWMVYVKNILFVYETGTYSINGNQITLSPKTGKGEWWSKAANGRTNEWGKRVSASTDYKMEKTTYTFDFLPYSEVTLLLRSARPTQRDGNNGDQAGSQEYTYAARDINKSQIDNPPGFRDGY